MKEKEKAARVIAPFLIMATQAACNTVEAPLQPVIQNSPIRAYLESPKSSEPNPIVTINKQTTGTLSILTPTFFHPDSNRPIQVEPIPKSVEVLSPTGRERFLIKTPTGNLEIPINQLDIQGTLSWANRTDRIPWLGFDCAQPELISRIPEVGAGSVRIPIEQADDNFFRKRPEVIKAINAAKLNRLKIMLLFNPTELISVQETEKRIDRVLNILGDYKQVSFELGNEPDLEWFWRDHDLDSFAKFINQTSQILAKKSPNSEQIIGGIAQHDVIRPFLQALRRNGVDPNRFSIGVHAYNSTKEVQDKIQTLKSELNPSTKLIFTEIGWNKSQSDKGQQIISMIEAGKALGVEEYYIFQLRNIPFSGTDDTGLWGYVTPGGKWEKQVWNLVDYIWGKAKVN